MACCQGRAVPEFRRRWNFFQQKLPATSMSCAGEHLNTAGKQTALVDPMFALPGCFGALKSVVLVLLCPITCPLGYCFRRNPPPKKQPRQEFVVIPAPPQEVIYEKPPPARTEYIESPQLPNLCPVFVPNTYSSLPNEGIQRFDILKHPDVPIGFQDMRFINPYEFNDHNQGPIAAQLPQIQDQNNMQGIQSFPQLQNAQSSMSNDIATDGYQ